MANLPLTEIVVPGSQDVLELAPDLSAEVSALQSAVNTLNTEVSSIPNGTYPNLTAGSILTDKYDTDTTPYLYRALPYRSKRLEDCIVGGSVVWNQLCNATSVTITSGHKYYMKKGGTETVGASDGTALTGLTVGTDIVRDLTQMLGSTIADYINSLGSTDGVAFLKRYFITIGVYDSYDTGTIKSVEATAHVTYDADDNVIGNYPLGDVVLRGIPKLVNNELVYDGDIYTHDGSVTRKYGVVDLGTLTYSLWNSNENRDIFAFTNAQIDDLKPGATNTEIIEAICPKFIATSYSSTWKIGEMSYISAPTQRIAFIVPHGQYADASAFKTAMSGTYLLYPLATTTTETTTPFEQYQVCETGGTEEYTTTNDVPVGHDTKYFTDVIGNIEDIPAPPTADGTYTLKVTVSSGVPTYAWV